MDKVFIAEGSSTSEGSSTYPRLSQRKPRLSLTISPKSMDGFVPVKISVAKVLVAAALVADDIANAHGQGNCRCC